MLRNEIKCVPGQDVRMTSAALKRTQTVVQWAAFFLIAALADFPKMTPSSVPNVWQNCVYLPRD